MVKEGDALSQIAVRFGVSITTLLWNNNMVSGDFIKIGQELEILPIDGIKYAVKSGDTVGGLAKSFPRRKLKSSLTTGFHKTAL